MIEQIRGFPRGWIIPHLSLYPLLLNSSSLSHPFISKPSVSSSHPQPIAKAADSFLFFQRKMCWSVSLAWACGHVALCAPVTCAGISDGRCREPREESNPGGSLAYACSACRASATTTTASPDAPLPSRPSAAADTTPVGTPIPALEGASSERNPSLHGTQQREGYFGGAGVENGNTHVGAISNQAKKIMD